MPRKVAEARAAGFGRSTPNQNPYLPPPVGRFKLSLNPFTLCEDLLGPEACLKFNMYLWSCCCIVILVVWTQFLRPAVQPFTGDKPLVDTASRLFQLWYWLYERCRKLVGLPDCSRFDLWQPGTG